MRHIALIFIFVFFTITTGFAQGEKEIKNLEKQWLIESYKTGDLKNFDRIVSDNFKITHSNGKVLTKAEKRADILKNQIKNPLSEDVFQIDDSSVDVTFYGSNVAVSKGYIIENYMWKGKRYLDYVHFTNTYVKKKKRWQVISCHLTRLNKKRFGGVAKEVSFKSTDGVVLYADIYESSKGKSAPLIMLFHQGGGDARGEYKPLIPRLQKENYNVIAVDLRTGGNRFGSENRTVAKLNGKRYSYCDAYSDLEATLDYAKREGFTGKKIAWGSSFSAALVFQLATKRKDELSGILGFSPASGGPMIACKPALYLESLQIPAIALRPKSEMQRESSQKQFELFKKHNLQTYISEKGVHGSSMLNKDRVKADVGETWNVVLEFIKKSLR